MFIDYGKIASSISFYEQLGFNRVEAPWWVPKSIMKITSPYLTEEEEESHMYYLEKNKKCLVASAEQSFLYLANQGLLPKGRYQATTPCFRDEIQGPMRRKFFIKNELIITDDVSNESLKKVIDDCSIFFKTIVPNPSLIKVVNTDQGQDIEYDGIEIGSYGIRSCSFLNWIYATGCAEPRLSRSIQDSNFKNNKK